MIALKMDSIGRKPLVLLCMLVAAVSCTFTTVTSGENNWMFIVSLLVTKSTVAGAYTLIRSGRIIQCFFISQYSPSGSTLLNSTPHASEERPLVSVKSSHHSHRSLPPRCLSCLFMKKSVECFRKSVLIWKL